MGIEKLRKPMQLIADKLLTLMGYIIDCVSNKIDVAK